MIDAHRGAFEYDWRTRFGKPLKAVGRSMSWGEALRLTQRLFFDPSSHVAASVGEWDYPASWDAITQMAHYDLTHQIAWARGGKKGPRPKPYPRPWPDGTVTKRGRAVSVDEFEAIRAAAATT